MEEETKYTFHHTLIIFISRLKIHDLEFVFLCLWFLIFCLCLFLINFCLVSGHAMSKIHMHWFLLVFSFILTV